jgi:hypothetical protein
MWIALAASATGYLVYGLAMRRSLVGPSRASWLIWSITTALEVFSYRAVNQSAAQNVFFVVSAICCVMTTVSVWKHGAWNPLSAVERITLAACVVAVILWSVFDDAWWGHLVMLLAVPGSFIPTWLLVRRAGAVVEGSPAWGLWSIADLLVVIAILGSATNAGHELPYALLELACNATTWLLVGLGSIDPRRTFQVLRNGLGLITHDRLGGRRFLIGRDRKGKAIYAGQRFAKGQEIVTFHGPVEDRSALPAELTLANDRFLQIDRDRFIGPSGDVDDLINHSCDPTAGIESSQLGVRVVALRDLAAGEEVTIDYSTTTLDAEWSMECYCGSRACRGTVRDFARLPATLQRHYRDLGVVPRFILDAVAESARGDDGSRPRVTAPARARRSWRATRARGGPRRPRRAGTWSVRRWAACPR